MRWLARATLAAQLALAAPAAHAGCAAASEPCAIAGGTYHIVLPERGDHPAPALMLLHGWSATGRGMLKMTALVKTVTRRGYALILPDGLPRPDGPGQDWAFLPGQPARRDEGAFLKAVADDAAARFGLDRDRMLLSGFSIGGSMVSYIACADPAAFAAYAPVAGSFWRPQPERCAGPVRLFHIHGWADKTVPLEGRHIEGFLTQGDVFAALDIWRRALGCLGLQPDRTGETGRFWLRSWTSCAPGGELLFALHPGAHGIPDGWVTLALDWFEGGAP